MLSVVRRTLQATAETLKRIMPAHQGSSSFIADKALHLNMATVRGDDGNVERMCGDVGEREMRGNYA